MGEVNLMSRGRLYVGLGLNSTYWRWGIPCRFCTSGRPPKGSLFRN
jgi:hypothetical protein